MLLVITGFSKAVILLLRGALIGALFFLVYLTMKCSR
jgi:hypothetical protein